MKLLELTDWDSGETIYIDPQIIRAIVQIQSSHSDLSGEPREYGRRTRIDGANGYCYLVREDGKDIKAMIDKSNGKSS